MKKFYTSPEYKRYHKRLLEKENRKNRNPKTKVRRYTTPNYDAVHDVSIYAIEAPPDFRLFANPDGCLEFFQAVRSEYSIFTKGKKNFVKISFANITQVDYAAICVIKAIVHDLKYRRIYTKCEFARDPECHKFLMESDFFDDFYKSKTQKFEKADKSDLIFFEKGEEKLKDEANRKIGELVKRVVNHLTGEAKHFNPVKTILLEVCGNSIEHAYATNKHWLLGLKYEEDKVIFTVTDVGKGILDTLKRKFKNVLGDFFAKRDNLEILVGAFQKKYGSSTEEVNRNKGLPSVRVRSENGSIRNLLVMTNNVILHFEDPNQCKVLKTGSARFKGTIYQWELTKECIQRTNRT